MSQHRCDWRPTGPIAIERSTVTKITPSAVFRTTAIAKPGSLASPLQSGRRANPKVNERCSTSENLSCSTSGSATIPAECAAPPPAVSPLSGTKWRRPGHPATRHSCPLQASSWCLRTARSAQNRHQARSLSEINICGKAPKLRSILRTLVA
jgi:hypothetical protein